MLYQLLKSKEPRERQIGQLLTGMEYENLVTALNLALEAQVSILNLHSPLLNYLDAIQDQRRGVDLGQAVLRGLEAYSPEKLAGRLGVEFVGAIDEIAKRQLLLKQYKEAEGFYQRALFLLLGNKSYDVSTITKFSASIYHQLGRVAQEQRQWQQASEYYLQTWQIFVEYQDNYSAGITLRNLARLWKASDDVNVRVSIAMALGMSVEETEKMLLEALGEKEEEG